MDDIVALLHELGFSDYEGRAYVALLQHSPLNGYEVAKASGVPRANVYLVLQKLEERGAVVRLDTPAGVRYAPVAPEELMQRLRSRLQTTLNAAEQALTEMAVPADRDAVWNVRGYPAMLEHATTLIDGTARHLLIAIRPHEAQALAPSLHNAEQRGVEITTLCLAACAKECGGCCGNIHRYRVLPDDHDRWLVLVPDNAEVLAGEIDPRNDAQTVRTRQRLLVELMSWFIRHSIALATLVSDLGPRLDHELSARTLAVLTSIGPSEQHGWLAAMRHWVRQDDREAQE